MGINDERLLSQKYFKEADEYYHAGLNTSNLTKRYHYWQFQKLYFNIAKNFEKIENLESKNVRK